MLGGWQSFSPLCYYIHMSFVLNWYMGYSRSPVCLFHYHNVHFHYNVYAQSGHKLILCGLCVRMCVCSCVHCEIAQFEQVIHGQCISYAYFSYSQGSCLSTVKLDFAFMSLTYSSGSTVNCIAQVCSFCWYICTGCPFLTCSLFRSVSRASAVSIFT